MHMRKGEHIISYVFDAGEHDCCLEHCCKPSSVVIRPLFMHKVLCAGKYKEIEEIKKLLWYQKGKQDYILWLGFTTCIFLVATQNEIDHGYSHVRKRAQISLSEWYPHMALTGVVVEGNIFGKC